MERRLAAILAADVVGYSRLMGDDEVGTLQRLTDVRKTLIEPISSIGITPEAGSGCSFPFFRMSPRPTFPGRRSRPRRRGCSTTDIG
jgi:hypothetical protein